MDDIITDAELDEWERIEREVMPGDWMWVEDGDLVVDIVDGGLDPITNPALACGSDNMKLAVTARNAFPRLLAEVRRARAQRLIPLDLNEGALSVPISGYRKRVKAVIVDEDERTDDE